MEWSDLKYYDPNYIGGILFRLEQVYNEVKPILGEAEANNWYQHQYNRYLYKLLEGRCDMLISADTVDKSAKVFKKQWDQHLANHKMPQEEKQSEEKSNYIVGDLLVPKDIDTLPILSAPNAQFVAPKTIDLRDYCLPTRDQGNKPWCAAYAAAGMVGNILWRKTDIPKEIDTTSLYQYAKTIDGTNDDSGTTLTAILDAVLHYHYFDAEKCKTRVIRNINQLQYAIHKFGCCLLGVNVSQEWYHCNKSKATISGKTNKTLLGGHAVLCCGYTRDGIIVQNSWGVDWGSYGFALITWEELDRIFLYGAVVDNCLYNTNLN